MIGEKKANGVWCFSRARALPLGGDGIVMPAAVLPFSCRHVHAKPCREDLILSVAVVCEDMLPLTISS